MNYAWRQLILTHILGMWALMCLANVSDLQFDVNAEVRAAHSLVMQLKLDEAEELLAVLKDKSPQNLMISFVEESTTFIKLFVGEDKALYAQQSEALDDRIDRFKEGDEASPWYLYTRAELYLHRAVVRFKFGELWGAAADLNRGFKLLKRNNIAFPEFAPNLKSLGVLKAGVGTIPDGYMWAVKLFSSLEGSIAEGLEDIERSIELSEQPNGEDFTLDEAKFLYAQILLHFANDAERAERYLEELGLDVENNPMHNFILANTAMKRGNNDRAVEILTAYDPEPSVYRVAYLKLMLGRAKLASNDPDAERYLVSYATEFDGMNYVKEAWQKAAWVRLMNEDPDGYLSYLDSCLVNGYENVDEDKHAQQEAEARELPDVGLLKAQILFDGGYNERAREVLRQVEEAQLNADETLEFLYRSGRVQQSLADYPAALESYQRTIEQGQDAKSYFACNAALQCGLIFEKQRLFDKAEAAYRQCLKLKPASYRASIHQKAKAGLNRLDNK